MGYAFFILLLWMIFIFEINYSYFVDAAQECNVGQNCIRNSTLTHILDPDKLWDSFPCPPPWKPQLILKLPWKERLGEVDGDRFCKRVAARCGLDLVALKASASKSTSDIFKDCDISCFVLVLAAFLCIVFLLVAAVAFFFIRRRRYPRLKSNKSTEIEIACDNSKLQSEVVLSNDEIKTQLLDQKSQQTITDPAFRFQKPYEFIFNRSSNLYEPDDIRKYGRFSDVDTKKYGKPSEENASLTYSAGESTLTYDSLNSSDYSESYRLSDSFTNRPLSEEIMLELKDRYGYESPISPLRSYFNNSQRCSCDRCSGSATYKSPKCSCYKESKRAPQRSSGYGSDVDNVLINDKLIVNKSTHTNVQQLVNLYQNVPYADEKIPVQKARHSYISLDQDIAQGCYYKPSQSSHRCSHVRSPTSKNDQFSYYNAYSHGNPTYSESKMNYPQNLHSNYQQCVEIIKNKAYSKNVTPRETFVMKESFNHPVATDNIISSDMNEHRKRRRSKHEYSMSSNSDNNTDSGKSHRRGIPKTNGSLLNSKFIHR